VYIQLYDPAKRISAADAMKHPYFRDIPGQVRSCRRNIVTCKELVYSVNLCLVFINGSTN